jgi:hypothetical protein
MNDEKLHKQWSKSVIVTIYKPVAIIEVQNCYQLKYKILFTIILNRLNQCVERIVKGLYGFQFNRLTTDAVSICCILEKEWEYNETVHQVFTVRLKKMVK